VEAKLEENEKKALAARESLPKVIQLNIGGRQFASSKDYLLKHPLSCFTGLLSGKFGGQLADGSFFIDRDPAVFDRLLNYLRTDMLDVECLNSREIRLLKEDFGFYCIDLPKELRDPPLNWDENKKSDHATIIKEEWSVEKTSGNDEDGEGEWNCGVIGDRCVDRYSVSVDAADDINIGFTTGEVWDPNRYNCKNGWFIYTYDGALYGIGGIRDKPYASRIYAGDIVTVIREGSNIRFEINGVDKGVAFKNVPNQPLYPALDLYSEGQNITLLN
jgi:hypothetical protein